MEIELIDVIVEYEDVSVRTARANTAGNPIITLCRELQWLGLKVGDKVLIGRKGNKIEIVKVG